ncbi:MAG: methyltransferase domain-containing protein [Thermomicrobiales bacterium]
MTRQNPGSGFSDVDRDSDPLALIHALDLRTGAPFHLDYKQRALALLGLHAGDQGLDIGCGTGEDVCQMAGLVCPGGRATGVDASETMIAEARRRHVGIELPVAFHVGEAEALPFADASFDGCLAIRTFQHLANPQRALGEMIRVARPGGRLVVIDPDHDTAVIDASERSLMRRFLKFRADTIRNGGIAHHMPALFKERGLLEVSVIPMTEVRTGYAEVEAASHFEGGIRIAHDVGVLTDEEADRLVSGMRSAADAGRFLTAMTYFLTVGRKTS